MSRDSHDEYDIWVSNQENGINRQTVDELIQFLHTKTSDNAECLALLGVVAYALMHNSGARIFESSDMENEGIRFILLTSDEIQEAREDDALPPGKWKH